MLQSLRIGIIFMAVAVLPVLPACKSVPGTPEQQAQIQVLEVALVEAESQGNPEAAAAIEADLATLEAESVTGLVTGLGTMLGGLLPENLAWLLGPTGVALAPLLFKRPRKNFGKAVGAINPFNSAMAPGEAFNSLLAAYGLRHSTKSSAEAALADEKAAMEAETV